MRVLGIDPGIATIGFGVVDLDRRALKLVTCGVVTTPAGMSLSARLERIYDDILELVKIYRPDDLAVEELFFNTNVKTGISVAHGRGVVLLAGYKAGLRIYEYTPLQVKQAVVGYGRADKKQVIDMVRNILGMSAAPKPDDAADAVAIAICHARSVTSLLNIEGRDKPCSTT